MFDDLVRSAVEIEQHWGEFNCSTRSLRDWAKKGLIRKLGDDRYDVYSTGRHLIKREQERANSRSKRSEAEGTIAELQQRKLAAEVRELEAKARLRELELDKQQELLVPAAEVLEAWTNKVLAARAKFLGIPSRLAAELAGVTDPALVELRLKTVIDEALWELGGDGNQSG